MNDQLQLNSDLALDPRINYHVSIGVNINPEVLDESVWEHLRNDRDMLEEWLKVVAPGLGDIVNTILIDYNERFRDVSEVGFFDNPPPYDPTVVRPLPHYVIERIRETLTYPGGGRGAEDGEGYFPGRRAWSGWACWFLPFCAGLSDH